MDDFGQAIKLKPNSARAYVNRASALRMLKKYDLALADYTRGIEIKPRDAQAYNDLARFLATCPDAKYRNGAKAVFYARRACELQQWKDFRALHTLAAAYPQAAQFGEAAKFQAVAIKLAPAGMKAELRRRLELYKAGQPFRQGSYP